MKIKSTKLAIDDSDRMTRLFEEVQSRLHEMTLIMNRVAKVEIGEPYQIKMGSDPTANSEENAAPSASLMRMGGIEFIYRNGRCVGIYDHDAKVCRAGCN